MNRNMFEPLFELIPFGRAQFERIFHRYEIDRTAYIGRGTKIIFNDKRNKGRFIMKKFSWIGFDCILDITDDIIIGKYVQIAPRVMIFTHDSSKDRKNPIRKNVILEDYSYIGTGSIILPGVRIGKRAIVGAGAVVTKDVTQNTIVCGVPAKVIGMRR